METIFLIHSPFLVRIVTPVTCSLFPNAFSTFLRLGACVGLGSIECEILHVCNKVDGDSSYRFMPI